MCCRLLFILVRYIVVSIPYSQMQSPPYCSQVKEIIIPLNNLGLISQREIAQGTICYLVPISWSCISLMYTRLQTSVQSIAFDFCCVHT